MKVNKYYKVEIEKIPSNGKKIELLIIKPISKNKLETPGILWIHGGGYIKGSSKMIFASRAIDLVKKYGAVVVSPEYRLAKEAPYPAALEDCYAALKYIKANADKLGINSSQIMVGGESAGGGLTAALCMYARDKGEVNIAYQMPLYPMLDNYDTESSKNNHSLVWNTKKNHKAWKKYLSNLNENEIPPYASAARQKNYSNLPPAYTFIGDKDLFYSETITFIENLKKANVEATIDIYSNCNHAFDMLFPFKKVSKKAKMEFEKNYLYAAENYFAPQNYGGNNENNAS